MKRLLLSILFFCLVIPVAADELSIRSFEPLTNDLTARTDAVLDLNGNKCALIKVALPQGGEFSGNVIRQNYHINEYLVYITQGSKYLQLRYPGMETLMIDLNPFTENKGVESGVTYRLRLDIRSGSDNRKELITGNYLLLDITPKTGLLVKINGKSQAVSDGQVSTYLELGSYDVSVEAPGYAPFNGRVTIGPDGKTIKNINLESILANLTVTCATPGASIMINGQPVGSGTYTGELNAGTYRIEVEKPGYRKYSETVNLREKERRQLNIPALEPIYSALDVAYTPNGSSITIDGNDMGTTPDIIRNILVGKHTVSISKGGYQTFSTEIDLQEGVPSRLEGALVPAPGTSSATTAASSPSTSYSSDAKMIYRFFPVYGVTLGKTTVKEADKLSYTKKASNKKARYVNDLAFWDHDEDGVFEEIYMTKYEKMPEKWQNELGIYWDLSYDEWIDLLQKLGFKIEVKSPPKKEKYDGKDSFSAAMEAISTDNTIRLRLNFNYNRNGGTRTSSKGTLYAITVDAL